MNTLMEVINAISGLWAGQMWSIIWQSSVLAGLVVIVTLLFRHLSAAVKFWLWMLVPLRLLVMPLITISLPLLPAIAPHEKVQEVKPAQIESASMEYLPLRTETFEVPRENLNYAPMQNTRPFEVERQKTEPVVICIKPNFWSLVMITWFAGIMFWTLRLLWSWRKIRYIVRNAKQSEHKRIIEQVFKAAETVGLKNTPSILVTSKDVSPFLLGVFRPVLIVPSRFVNTVSNDGLLAVFSHEFAHLRRKDTLVGWILAICEAFYFFHPVLHFVKKRILFERERACDDWVIASGNSHKKIYANALIDAAGICRNFSSRLGPTGVVAESFGDLKKRIIAIGSNLKPKTRLSKTALVLLLLIGTMCVPGFVLTNRTIAASEKATLETVREMVARNEALINPIKMEYTKKNERTGEYPTLNTGGGRRGSGSPITRSEHTWAQDDQKNYVKVQYFSEPNEPGRIHVYKFDNTTFSISQIPDYEYCEVRAKEGSDNSYIDYYELGLGPFGGEFKLSEILVSDYATLHRETEIVNGRETYVVDAGCPPYLLYYARIWIDKQRGMPLRIWYYTKHPAQTDQETISEINDIELHKLPNGAWLPVKGTRSINSTNYISYEHISVDIDSITTKKEDIPESLFEIDFPDGARVHNVFTGLISVKGQSLKTYEEIVEGAKNYIAGTIVDVNGIPVPDVVVRPQTIQVKQSDGRSNYRILQAEKVNCAISDLQGRFAIELAEEGLYELDIYPKDFIETNVRVPLDEHNLKVVLEKGGTIQGRVVRYAKGKKVPVTNSEVEVESERFVTLRMNRLRAKTDSDGRFEIKYLSTHLSPRNSDDTEYRPRSWQIRCGSTTQTVVFEQGADNKEVEILLNPDMNSAIPLIDRALPEFDGIKLDYDIKQAENKKMLICFFDLEQRPARNCLLELSKRIDVLAQKGISVLAVHASDIEKNTLDEWLKENNITIPVGIVEDNPPISLKTNEQQIRFKWAIQSLPWLILTDAKHIVTDEGFSIDELDEKVSKVYKNTVKELDGINFYRKEGLKNFFHADSLPDDIFNDPNQIAPDSLITIKTIDQEGKPVPYCRIVVVDRDNGETGMLYESATNEKGLAYFNIQDEQFSVNTHLYEYNPATGEGHSQNHKIGRIYNRFDNNTVTVKWNPFPVGDCKVTGQVLDQHGMPLTQYELTLNYLEGVRTDWSESYSTYQSIQVNNPEGRFEFDNLLPRTYSYKIRAEDYSAYDWDFDMGEVTIPEEPNAVVNLDIEVEANELLYGRAFYQDGTPLAKGGWMALFSEYTPEEVQMYHGQRGEYFAERIDPNGFFRVTLSQKEIKDLTECTGGKIEISDYSSTIGMVHIDKLSKDRNQVPSLYFPRGKPKDTLVGLTLPEFRNIKTDFNLNRARDKKILVCFFDFEQRPSRNCLLELSKRVEDLSKKGISVIAVHSSNIDKSDLDAWFKENNITIPIGMIESGHEQTLYNWAVKSLPWFVLTGTGHIVTDEGFSIDELDEKLTLQSQDRFSGELLNLQQQDPLKIGQTTLIDMYEKFISKYQDESRVAEAIFDLANIYESKWEGQNYDKAIELFEKAAKTSVPNTDTWKKANIYWFNRVINDDIQKAENILLDMKNHLRENDAVLEAEIEDRYVYFYGRQKRFDEAEKSYSRILELNKDRTKITDNIEDRIIIENCFRTSSQNLLACINNAIELAPAKRLAFIREIGNKYNLFSIFDSYNETIKQLESQVSLQDTSSENTSVSYKDGTKGEISGVVQDFEGKPVFNAFVEILNKELVLSPNDGSMLDTGNGIVAIPPSHAAYTDSDGHFKIAGLRSGKTDIVIKIENYQTKILNDIPSGISNLEVVLNKPAAFKIKGEVVDSLGNPVKDVQVSLLQNLGKAESKSVRTDNTGQFGFSDILEPTKDMNSRVLIAQKDGFGIWGKRIDSTGGESYIKITLLPEETVTGRVVDDKGKPIENAEVSFWSCRGENLDFFLIFWQDIAPSVKTNTDGQFIFKGIPPKCNVFFNVSADGYISNSIQSLNNGYDGGYVIRKKDGTVRTIIGELNIAQDDIEFVLKKGATLRGTVTYKNSGLPAEGIELFTQQQDRDNRSDSVAWVEGVTDENGKFELEGVSTSPCNLMVRTDDSEGYLIPEWTAAAKEIDNLKAGKVKDKIKIVLVKGGIMRGKVTDVKGNPLHDIAIAFYSSARPLSSAACQVIHTAKDGTWSYRFPPGEVYAYVMTNAPQGANWSKYSYTKKIKEGKEIKNIDFKLDCELPENSTYRK